MTKASGLRIAGLSIFPLSALCNSPSAVGHQWRIERSTVTPVRNCAWLYHMVEPRRR